MTEKKKCNCCGKEFNSVDEILSKQGLGVAYDLYWFNCDCGSTLVVDKSVVSQNSFFFTK